MYVYEASLFVISCMYNYHVCKSSLRHWQARSVWMTLSAIAHMVGSAGGDTLENIKIIRNDYHIAEYFLCEFFMDSLV